MNKKFYEGKIKGYIALAPVITLKYSTQSFLKAMSMNSLFPIIMQKYKYLEIFSDKH